MPHRHGLKTTPVVATHLGGGRGDKPGARAGEIPVPLLSSCEERASSTQNSWSNGIDFVLAQEPQRNSITKFRIHTSQPCLKAVRSFARTWTAELKERSIRVNVLSAGHIDTPIFETGNHTKAEIAAWKAKVSSSIPLGRLGRSEEVAKVLLFLASQDSSYVAGVELFADGGMGQI